MTENIAIENEKEKDYWWLQSVVSCVFCANLLENSKFLECRCVACADCIAEVADANPEVKCPRCSHVTNLQNTTVDGLTTAAGVEQFAKAERAIRAKPTGEISKKSQALINFDDELVCYHMMDFQNKPCPHCGLKFCHICQVVHIVNLKQVYLTESSKILEDLTKKINSAGVTTRELLNLQNAKQKLSKSQILVKNRTGLQLSCQDILERFFDLDFFLSLVNCSDHKGKQVEVSLQLDNTESIENNNENIPTEPKKIVNKERVVEKTEEQPTTSTIDTPVPSKRRRVSVKWAAQPIVKLAQTQSKLSSTDKKHIAQKIYRFVTEGTTTDLHNMWKTLAGEPQQVRRALLNQPDKEDSKRTALHKACYHSKPAIVKFLIEEGANRMAKDASPKSLLPIELATWADSWDIVSDLLLPDTIENYDYNSKAMIAAIQSDNMEMVHKISFRCPNLLNFSEKQPSSFLHEAADCGNDGMLSYLYSKKMNLAKQDSDGNTPLHIACIRGHANVAALLKDYKPKLAEMRNAAEKTALDIAIVSQHSEIVSLLQGKIRLMRSRRKVA